MFIEMKIINCNGTAASRPELRNLDEYSVFSSDKVKVLRLQYCNSEPVDLFLIIVLENCYA